MVAKVDRNKSKKHSFFLRFQLLVTTNDAFSNSAFRLIIKKQNEKKKTWSVFNLATKEIHFFNIRKFCGRKFLKEFLRSTR